jgi:TP901 family phage tail tape measure protein
MARAFVEATLQLRDELSSKIQIANKNLATLNKQVARNQKSLERVGKNTSFVRLAGTIISAHAAMALVSRGFRELTQLVSGSIDASTEFNDAFTKSTAIMGDLSDTMKTEMVTAAEEVAQTTTFSAKEAAEAYFFLASAGLDAAQSIGALPQVSQFAQAGTFDLATATDLLTDAQSALGLTIRDDAIKNMENMAKVSDVLVKANTLSNASVRQFSEALTTKAGAALRRWHKDVEEGVAVLSVFADQGIKGAEAGTGLSIVLRDLSTKALKNAEDFKRFGVAVFDSENNMRNMGDIISDLEGALGGMSDAQAKATLLQLGFTDKSVSFISSLIGMSEQIRDYETALRDAGGITEEVANKQLQSFAAQMKLASNHVVLLMTEIGNLTTESEGMKEIFQFVVDLASDATKFLKENNEAFKSLATEGLAEVAESFAVFFDIVGKGLDATAKWFKFWWTISKNTLLLFPSLFSDSVAQFIESTDAAIEATDRLGDVFDDTLAERLPKLAGAIRQTGEQVSKEVKAINEELKHLDFVGPLQAEVAFIGEFADEFERLGDPLGDFREHYEALGKAQKELNEDLDDGTDVVEKLGKTIATKVNPAFKQFYSSMLDNAPTIQGTSDLYIEASSNLDKWGHVFVDFIPQVRKYEEQAEEAVTTTENFSKILEEAANLTVVFGNTIGSVFGGAASAIGGFSSLFGGGKGFSGFFKEFTKEGQVSFGSIFSGLASSLPAIGAIVGPITQGIKALAGVFSKPEYKKVMEDAGRDLGVSLGEGLSKQIADLSEQIGDRATAIQLSLGDIFGEALVTGTANFDVMAEQIADTFSFLERGQITATQAQQILNESVAQLLPHLDELGPAGEAQLQRLINAAEEFGITFEGLAEIGGPIASSVEEIAEQFGITTGKAKELAKFLGVDVKNNVQRLADELGIPPKILKQIGEAVKADFGIPLEGIQGLLNTMGISIEDLAAAFGIEIPNSIRRAASEVGNLANEIDRIPRTVNVDINQRRSNRGSEGISAQGGLHIPMVTMPEIGPIFAHRGESVHIDKPSLQPMSSQPIVTHNHITVTFDGKVMEKKIVTTVNKASRLGDLTFDSSLADPRA